MGKISITTRRAILPEVMLAEDVALALGVPIQEAARLMAGGSLGPCRKLGARNYVTREGLLRSIQADVRPCGSDRDGANREASRDTP